MSAGDTALEHGKDVLAAQDFSNAYTAYSAGKDNSAAIAAQSALNNTFTASPKSFANLSSQQKTALYGSSQAPQLTGMGQGDHGDCYLYSALSWYAKNDPGYIENSIAYLGKNDFGQSVYQVTLANNTVEQVTLVPGTNTPYAGQNKTDGRWIDIMVNAYAQAHGVTVGQAEGDNKAGGQQAVLRAFTGERYQYPTFSKFFNGKKGTSLLYGMLQGMCNSQGIPSEPIGLIAGKGKKSTHALTIIQVNLDSSNQGESTVIIQNPWGTAVWFNPATLRSEPAGWTPPAGKTGDWVKMAAGGTFPLKLSQLCAPGHDGFDSIGVPVSDLPASIPVYTGKSKA